MACLSLWASGTLVGGEEPTLTTGACGDPDSLGSLTARVGDGAGLICREVTAPVALHRP